MDNPLYEPYWEDPKGNMIGVSCGIKYHDYLNDLNAMNSAVLQKFNGPAHEGWAFIDNLRVACGIPHRSACMALVCATAAQRAEAFLRTLNLWKP